MQKVWLSRGWAEDDKWDPEVEYWERVEQHNNPSDIGVVMPPRLLKLKGIKVDIKLPDYDGILGEIRRRAGLQAGPSGHQWP
jgi:hypothetical protein